LGPALFALVVPLLASPFDLNGTVVAEGRAGTSPLVAGQNTQGFVAGIVTPHLEAVAHDETLELRVEYVPRFMWQTPNLVGYAGRPLILHQATVNLTGRPSSTTVFTANGYASYGQPDYSILPQLIGPGQATLPQVQDIVSARGSGAIQQTVTRRLRLTLAGELSYFHVLDGFSQNATAMAPVLPHQRLVNATPGAGYYLTRNDELLLTATVADNTYVTYAEIQSVTPLVTWHQRGEAGSDSRLSLGLSYARDVGTQPAINGGSALLPAASAEIHRSLLVQEDYGLWMTLRVSAEQYVDPLLLAIGPRYMALGQILLIQAPDWSLGVEGTFSTTFLAKPTVMTAAGVPAGEPDQTTVAVRVPARHRFSENFLLEFGGYYADRAPALTSSDFHFHQRVVWAFFSLTASTRPVGWFPNR
jgi:hypothetical protein